MGQMFNNNVIYNTLDIEEKILNSIKRISKFQSFSDIDLYNDEIDKIILYYRKEKILLSKIPDDINFYNFLFDFLKNSSFDLKDEKIIVSRFRNILYNKYLALQPQYEVMNNTEEYDDFDEDLNELKVKLFIRDNLLCEYIKSFEKPMLNCDKKSYDIFNNIRLYNIFLNKNLFDFWIKSDFNMDAIKSFKDEEIIKFFNISKDDYYSILNDTIAEICANLLTIIFSDVKKPKSNIIVQDSFFNFKFLIKKLSTDSMKNIKNEIDSVYLSVGEYGLLSDVIDMIDIELENRDDKDLEVDNDNFCVDSTVFDNVISLVKLEDKIFDLYNNIDFNSSDNNLNSLCNFISLEKEMITKIDFSSSLVTILNDLFNNNLWIYLTGNVDEKAYVISQRLKNLLPFYVNLKISPSQKLESYNFIYRNHMIRSLKNLWILKNECEDEVIKKGFEQIYKYHYFINPELTDEYLVLNGNHNLLFDLSSDLSGLDSLEYEYDKNEQLFNLGCDILSYIFDNENNINFVLDYGEFQLKINELMDIISELSIDYNKKLYRYLMEYSSFFSPLRHDIRKIFKDKFNSFKVKSINK